MGEALITRRGGGGGVSIDNIVNGDIALYVPSTTNIQFPDYYNRGAFSVQKLGSETRGLLCWQTKPWASKPSPVRGAIIDWAAQTVTLVIKPSGHTNKVYGSMFSSGTCYVAFQDYEYEDEPPMAVYIPEM